MRRLCSALALALTLDAGGVQAEVFVHLRPDGTLELTDRPTGGGLDQLVERTAARHGLDARLVKALIRVESDFDPRAVSPKGAAGLMQLMPATARRYGVIDPFDPAQNLEGGVRYLRDLLALFDGDLTLALAAYNAGEAAVLRHGRRVPPYPESRRYVLRVRTYYEDRLK